MTTQVVPVLETFRAIRCTIIVSNAEAHNIFHLLEREDLKPEQDISCSLNDDGVFAHIVVEVPHNSYDAFKQWFCDPKTQIVAKIHRIASIVNRICTPYDAEDLSIENKRFCAHFSVTTFLVDILNTQAGNMVRALREHGIDARYVGRNGNHIIYMFDVPSVHSHTQWRTIINKREIEVKSFQSTRICPRRTES